MIIVTNGLLAKGSLLDVLAVAIAKYSPSAVYLRETHISDEEYFAVASQVKELLSSKNIPLYISHRVDIAKALGIRNIHISYAKFKDIDRSSYDNISVAVHSIEEAVSSEQLGATRLMYGHIFATDCKEGIAPRGVDKLTEMIRAVSLPVVAIGGITASNVVEVLDCGVYDYAVMSSAMELNYETL